MDSERQLRELRLRCINLRRRFRDGPLAPIRIAFFGPTGAGKSKLFSSLIGKSLSGSGFKRPFTRRSFYYVHDQWQSLVAALEGEVAVHEDQQWEDTIVVDTPDFDSVELANRDEAERVFLEADRFLFVTDALKYADASTWEYMARIKNAEKEFAVILNKTNSAEIPDSFHARYRDTFSLSPETNLPYSTVVVPEFPIRDDDVIPETESSIQSLRAAAKDLSEANPADSSGERMRRELTGIFDDSDELLTEVRLRKQQVEELRQQLQQRFNDSLTRLENRLSEGLEPAVRTEVYQRVMKQLEKIDLLRYPRKIIAMPINGLRSLWNSWSGNEPDDNADREVPTVVDPVSTETFHLLESELIRFADESRRDVIQKPGLKRLMTRDVFRDLRLEHEELQELYRKHHDEFKTWVETHARDTAAEITGENKFKFILSQVLFHTVLITAQVQTGGGFTLVEAGLDGIVSPFIAKVVSVAIGNEKVKAFESDAHKQHQMSLSQIISVGRDRFDDFLEKSSRGLADLENQLVIISNCRPQTETLVSEFQSQPSTEEEL